MNNRSKKTAAKTAARRPQVHGGALLAGGVPGNKGGTGRPSNAFKDFLAELRRDPEVQDAIARAARDETSRNFKAAIDTIVRYDTEVPAEKHDHTHVMTDEQREAKVLSLLTAAKQRKARAASTQT